MEIIYNAIGIITFLFVEYMLIKCAYLQFKPDNQEDYELGDINHIHRVEKPDIQVNNITKGKVEKN